MTGNKTRLCPACWACLSKPMKDAVYDADDGPNGPNFLRAMDEAVKQAQVNHYEAAKV